MSRPRQRLRPFLDPRGFTFHRDIFKRHNFGAAPLNILRPQPASAVVRPPGASSRRHTARTPKPSGSLFLLYCINVDDGRKTAIPAASDAALGRPSANLLATPTIASSRAPSLCGRPGGQVVVRTAAVELLSQPSTAAPPFLSDPSKPFSSQSQMVPWKTILFKRRRLPPLDPIPPLSNLSRQNCLVLDNLS